MPNATRSAATAISGLFGTVTVATGVVTTAINALGDACDVMNVASQAWLAEARERAAGMAEERTVAIIDEVTFAIATRVSEREKSFAGNPQLKAAYDAAIGRVQEAVLASKAA